MEDTPIIKPVNGVQSKILQLIGGYLIKTQKSWALIDQKWMLRSMAKWYGVNKARSVLCYNIKVLIAEGYLDRTTRHRTNPETGKFEPRPSLYKMTWKLKGYILSLAAYMRGIGWKNYITVAVKKARETTQRAIEAARAAELPTMTFEDFKGTWRQALGVRT